MPLEKDDSPADSDNDDLVVKDDSPAEILVILISVTSWDEYLDEDDLVGKEGPDQANEKISSIV